MRETFENKFIYGIEAVKFVAFARPSQIDYSITEKLCCVLLDGIIVRPILVFVHTHFYV